MELVSLIFQGIASLSALVIAYLAVRHGRPIARAINLQFTSSQRSEGQSVANIVGDNNTVIADRNTSIVGENDVRVYSPDSMSG